MRERIITVMRQVFKVDELPECPSQATVEAWDSLRHLNLMIDLEMEFDVEFEPEEIAKMKSIDRIEEVIGQKMR